MTSVARPSSRGELSTRGEPSADRVGATRAKLAERRAALLRRRSSLDSSTPIRNSDVGGGAPHRARRRTYPLRSSSSSASASTSTATATARRRVTFSDPLVTEVRARPYTSSDDKRRLYYTRDEMAEFKARWRDGDDAIVTFAEGTVTDVWVVEDLSSDEELRGRLYYDAHEIGGFLRAFLATLDGGGGCDADSDDDDKDDNDEDEEGEDAGEGAEESEEGPVIGGRATLDGGGDDDDDGDISDDDGDDLAGGGSTAASALGSSRRPVGPRARAADVVPAPARWGSADPPSSSASSASLVDGDGSTESYVPSSHVLLVGAA